VDYTAFIRELLFSHDCVIIPGFGGFIGNYAPARIDRVTGTFYPPLKQISFNRNLIHNDGLLVGRISGATGVNYGDARSMVGEFTADLRRKLERGEKIVFDHIGSFDQNAEGNIQFEPDRSANYHLDSYGLEPFRMMPLDGHYLHARAIKTVDRDSEKQTAARKILWRAAVIVPLLAVLVAVPLRTDLFRSKIESSNLNPLVTAEFEQNRKAVEEGTTLERQPSSSNISENTDTSAKQDAAPVIETPVNPAPVAVTSPKVAEFKPAGVEAANYYLITGSFKSEENALSHVRILKSKGFSAPEVVRMANGFYRVYAMSCSDLVTAEMKKDSITAQFPGAWVSAKK